MLPLRKGIHTEQLQWESTRKGPMAWANMYGAEYLGMGDTIYYRYGRLLIDTDFPTRWTLFGKFMRVSKLRMGVIKIKTLE